MNNSPRSLGPAPTPVAAPELTAAQRATLEQLRTADGPVRVGEVADGLGLHANTVREHLDALVDAGLATRTRAASSGRGRPAWLYRAAPAEDATMRAYAGMAIALAGHLRRTADDPRAQARELGRAWAHDLTDHPADVLTHLREFGFAPVSDESGIALTRCPLLDAARRYPDITCQLHVGLIQGALDALGDTDTRPVLIPFAAPGVCTLKLEPTGDSDRPDQ